MTQKCPFEVGKEYKTRDGRTAKIIAIVPEANEHQQLVSLINGVVYGHFLNGIVLTYEDNPVDLLLPEKPRRVLYQVLCIGEDGIRYIPDRLVESEQSARNCWEHRFIRLLTENPIYVDGPEK